MNIFFFCYFLAVFGFWYPLRIAVNFYRESTTITPFLATNFIFFKAHFKMCENSETMCSNSGVSSISFVENP